MLFNSRTPGRLHRTIACLLLVTYAPACSSWHVVGPSPAEFVQTRAPERIRVTRIDSSQVLLNTPQVHGDTLVGLVGGGLRKDDTTRQQMVLLSEVRTFEVRKFDTVKTLGLVGVTFGLMFIIACAEESGSDSFFTVC